MVFSNSVTRGGQTIAHKMRMGFQVFRNIFFLSLVIFLGIFGYKVSKVDFALPSCIWYQIAGETKTIFDRDATIQIQKKHWDAFVKYGITYNQYSIPYSGSGFAIEYYKIKDTIEKGKKLFFRIVKKDLYFALKIALLVAALSLIYFFLRGKKLSGNKKVLSGTQMTSAFWFNFKLYFKGNASKIKLGNLSLPKDCERRHILISGGTGSGKTNCFHHVLPTIRESNEKVVIIDTTGEFIAKYYREGKDVLLNPLDKRSKLWSPWAECTGFFDYEALAESFITSSFQDYDRFWRDAARHVFCSLLMKNADTQDIELVRDALFSGSLKNLSKLLSGTKGAAHINPSSEKTAENVRSMAVSYLGCLDLLENSVDPFSIKKWIEQEKEDSWLFLSCRMNERTTMLSLLSAWFSTAMRSAMSLSPDSGRKIWFIVDELASLKRLRDLEICLTEGRKYGCCALLALQSPSQLRNIYGQDVATIITGNCNTKIVFSETDPEIAKQLSRGFGDMEIIESREGISYGAHEMRDGVNLSSTRRIKPAISAADIQSLPKHQAFVKMPDGMPIVKVKLQYQNLSQISEPFVLDEDKNQRMNDRLLSKQNEKFTELEWSQDEEDLDGNFSPFQKTKERTPDFE